MLKTIAIATASLALLLSAGAANAQKIDANGRCHDASGKFASAAVCGGAPKASGKVARAVTASAQPATATVTSTTAAAGAASTTRCKDAKGKFIKCETTTTTAAARCKTDKGKFAKCGTPGAHPA